MTNKLFELAAKRRSVRRYTKDHISDDVLKEIMKVADEIGARSLSYTQAMKDLAVLLHRIAMAQQLPEILREMEASGERKGPRGHSADRRRCAAARPRRAPARRDRRFGQRQPHGAR